jgi:type IV pilus assembly protein PilY1
MPWEARLKIKNLPVDPAFPRSHYVDGDPQSADVWFYDPFDPDDNTKNVNGSEWHTILVGAMREGGHHYYALDITNPSGCTQPGGGAALEYPGYLWEFPTEADFADVSPVYFPWMGETWGKPIITKVRLMVAGVGPVDRWVVIVTAGYDPNADPNSPDVTGLAPPPTYNANDPAVDPLAKRGRAIFMLDAMTGEVIAMKGYEQAPIDPLVDPTMAAQNDMKYAIVGRPSVLDLNGDGFADLIYFVDMGGQVFKWVIAAPGEDCVNDAGCDATQPSWPFKLFFTAPIATIGGTDFFKNLFFSPAAAYSGGRLWLAFGSGERRSLSFEGVGGDPDSKPGENNRYYVVSDSDPYERLLVPAPTLTEGDLTSLTGVEDGSAAVGSYGFYFTIDNGEKFVTNSEIFAGHVIAASFKPTTGGDPCTGRGDGTLYIFDLLTGEGYFDDGAGNPTRGLDIGGGLPNDPQISVGVGGKDNIVVIEKGNTAIEGVEEENINVGGGLLYWRERF